MNRHLHIELVGDREALIDRRRRRPPVLVELQPERAGAQLLAQRLRAGGVALAQKAEIQREGLGRFVHPADVPRPGRARRRLGAGGRPGAAADERRRAGIERVGNLVGRNEMHVRVDRARGQEMALAGENLGRRADFEPRGHPVHHPRVSGFADRRDASVADADVGLATDLKAAKKLRWVQSFSAGVENQLFLSGNTLMRDSAIVLTNNRIVEGPELADHALAMLLMLTRQLPRFLANRDKEVWQGDSSGIVVLKDKTAVVIGVGAAVDAHGWTRATPTSRIERRRASPPRAPRHRRVGPQRGD